MTVERPLSVGSCRNSSSTIDLPRIYLGNSRCFFTFPGATASRRKEYKGRKLIGWVNYSRIWIIRGKSKLNELPKQKHLCALKIFFPRLQIVCKSNVFVYTTWAERITCCLNCTNTPCFETALLYIELQEDESPAGMWMLQWLCSNRAKMCGSIIKQKTMKGFFKFV